ncbi:hypothetical protein BDZ45DRAFT_736131 [Acephala macrosclerotiorum]|nr:hypothetical protein BDZ45DRAFT_736131 [Acephala macrosclerotiorum]
MDTDEDVDDLGITEHNRKVEEAIKDYGFDRDDLGATEMWWCLDKYIVESHLTNAHIAAMVSSRNSALFKTCIMPGKMSTKVPDSSSFGQRSAWLEIEQRWLRWRARRPERVRQEEEASRTSRIIVNPVGQKLGAWDDKEMEDFEEEYEIDGGDVAVAGRARGALGGDTEDDDSPPSLNQLVQQTRNSKNAPPSQIQLPLNEPVASGSSAEEKAPETQRAVFSNFARDTRLSLIDTSAHQRHQGSKTPKAEPTIILEVEEGSSTEDDELLVPAPFLKKRNRGAVDNIDAEDNHDLKDTRSPNAQSKKGRMAQECDMKRT